MAKRAISGLLIVILLCGGAFYYYTTTPGYAVTRIQDALAEGDVATFEKYVDLDRLLETHWGEVINVLSSSSNLSSFHLIRFHPMEYLLDSLFKS